MALPSHLLTVMEEQKALVLALEDPRITDTAKEIAFYVAMIDAAIDDPMDNSQDQDDMLEYFQNRLTELTETYQNLVNDAL